jgi:hypothetical protein
MNRKIRKRSAFSYPYGDFASWTFDVSAWGIGPGGDCGAASLSVNRFGGSMFHRRLALPRPIVIIIAIAAFALIAGFLAFGGANMGN